MHDRNPSAVQGAVAGVLAGLAASYVMARFQAGLAALDAAPPGGDDPATVRAAERIVGRPIAGPRKAAAGEIVHYGFGALLGAMYGAGVEVAPSLGAVAGLPFGLMVMLVADEGLVPAAGLSGALSETPPSTHAYSAASHAVFGVALEVTRRIFRWAL